ncbi:hypothetical protein [Aquimarina spongiae]|nr:hypothetical protein [Aquimarina spongiae]
MDKKNNNIKKTILLLGLFLIAFIVRSQDEKEYDPFYVSEHIPSSPETGNLGEYGNYAASPYNGTANVHVPIYTINWEGLQIPIQINYDTGGVKVASEASWVGLNWSLSTSFGIHRRVYGQDDFSEKIAGGYAGAPKSGYIFNDLDLEWQEGTARPFLDYSEILDVHHSFGLQTAEGRASRYLDTQPDIFTVNLFGQNYKFMLNKKGSHEFIDAIVFNNKNVRITFNLTAKTFTLLDEHGFTYYFNTKEINTTFNTIQGNNPLDSSSYQGAISNIFALFNRADTALITNWSLDRVVSPRGRELNFEYQKGLYFTFPNYSIIADGRDKEHWSNWPQEQHQSAIQKKIHSVSTTIIENNYLTSIQGDFGEINFDLGPRQDLSTGSTINTLSNNSYGSHVLITAQSQIRSCHGASNSCGTSTSLLPKKLNSIEVINSNGKKVIDAQFHQSYFNSNKSTDAVKERNLRLKLDGITVNDRTHEFNYLQENSLAPKDSNGVDFWGYDNGVFTNDTKIPRIGRFITSRVNMPGNRLEIAQSFVKYNGAIRKSNFTFGKRGALTEVIFPTKGKTIFEYEPHEVVMEAPAPFTVTDYFPAPNQDRLRWTDMRDESKFKLTYQYLKYAKDSRYNYFEKNAPVIQGDAIEIELTLDNRFEVDFPSLVKIDGYLKTHTGWEGLGFYGSQAVVVVENVNTGVEKVVFRVSDAPNDFGNSSTRNDVSKIVSLAPGEYLVKTKAIVPSGDPNTRPPTPAVEYQSTKILLQTFESIGDQDISDIIETFEIGGLRIKKIIHKDSDNSFLKATAYNYNNPDALDGLDSSGKLMDDLIFHSKASGFHSYNPREYGDFNLTETNMVGGNNSAQGSHIGYSLVREFNVDEAGNTLGWIERKYHNQKNEYFTDSFNLPYSYDYLTGNGDPYISILGTQIKWTCSGLDFGNNCRGDVKYRSTKGYAEITNTVLLGLPLRLSFAHANGNVLEERVFAKDETLIEKTENTYQYLNGNVPNQHFASFLSVGLKTLGTTSQGAIESSLYDTWDEGPWGANHHTYFPYLFPIHHGQVSRLLNSKNYKIFDSEELVTQQINTYNEDTHHVKEQKSILDQQKEQITKLFYPYDTEVYNNANMNLLRQENRVATVIQSESYKNSRKQGTVLYEYANNGNTGGTTLVHKIAVGKAAHPVDERTVFELYDDHGNVLQKKLTDGIRTTYIWGYDKQYPVAKIENATRVQVEALSGFGANFHTGASGLSASQESTLRNGLANALITTYTYEPLIGITSMTDPKGYTMTYHYDAFNRLEFVKDQQGNLVSENKYNYKN